MGFGHQNSRTVLWFGIFVFTLAHLALGPVKIEFGFPLSDAPKAKPDEVYVELQGPINKNDEREVIRTSRVEETEDAKDMTARYLAEERNRVKEETRAKMRGNFMEGGGGTPQGDLGEGNGLPPGPGLTELMPFSTSPYHLPDAKDGAHTVINTDPVMYASFINRVADEIYDPWNRFFREALADPYVRRRAETNTYITKVLVLLNGEGEVTSIQTLQSSGLDQLDEAARQAFWTTGPFQNPPEQMLQADGFIRLSYTFTMELKTSSLNLLPLRL